MTTILVAKINFSQQKVLKWQQILSLENITNSNNIKFRCKTFRNGTYRNNQQRLFGCWGKALLQQLLTFSNDFCRCKKRLLL
jgi:hypothetical protein